MEMFNLGGGLAVCSNPGGHFHGWMLKRHPDGQWVSIAKLDAAALPADPLTQGLRGLAIETPAVRMARELQEVVGHLLQNEFDMRHGMGASKCQNVAREILDRLAASPPITRPGPPDTELFLNRTAVRSCLIGGDSSERDMEIAEGILADIDALPIVTAGELRERPVADIFAAKAARTAPDDVLPLVGQVMITGLEKAIGMDGTCRREHALTMSREVLDVVLGGRIA